MSETLGLKNVNLLSKEQYNGITPASDELYAISGSGFGFPSNRYEDLTLGASTSTYTAPANGYFYISANGTASNNWIEMFNTTSSGFARGVYGTAAWQFKHAIEAKKKDVIRISYSNIGTPSTFRFIYAEGE